ncbi:Tryptophan biosynthesis protein TrpCF [Buchnera aphidicola (Cinara pseudotaxifoliae)]|uniref:Multifunctional fusion protein n=1 Tax=Buchnera aphidicola (Cinara pseudotaxifoliae) TaxID=655384 RepID=A0A451DGY1_9GAMM|nr:bifunctional indole-3-glycerol-phosphate synthase TrpC/phosphoribosylanthranilate isomerase TrpF [Buchnera aphidicola]VFP85880.1 Tryptophan biosynthesis protein TrpCF [Buchnera aphidicola (Cinara pseudotaxifoliae)]
MKNNIISKILQCTQEWVYHKKKSTPLNSFYGKIKKTNCFFEKKLKKNRPSFILECKKSSPLNGVIRKKFDISEIISTYHKYADVISVITEKKFFNGSFRYLLQAREQTDKPLLCKDFFIDPYQIYYARYHQADAILLMLSILDNETYIKLSKIAISMNLGVLTEIHTLEELKRALFLKAKIIGINNRNLNDLSVNLDTTKKLSSLIPHNKIIICESGIKKYQEIRSFSKLVDGFLIGTHLMRSKNLEFSVRKLIYGNNKICGLTIHENAWLAEKVGCVYGGLIFTPSSKRCITIQKGMKIIKNNLLKYVGVFCNQTHQDILKKVCELNLYAVQLHGTESKDFIITLKKLLPSNVRIWKAVPVKKNTIIYTNKNINRYILDHKTGGTGKNFNWKLIKKFNISNMMLAGGLNLKNIFLASTLGFIGLDLNSGLEICPGIKDPKKIKLAFTILRLYSKNKKLLTKKNQ